MKIIFVLPFLFVPLPPSIQETVKIEYADGRIVYERCSHRCPICNKPLPSILLSGNIVLPHVDADLRTCEGRWLRLNFR